MHLINHLKRVVSGHKEKGIADRHDFFRIGEGNANYSKFIIYRCSRMLSILKNPPHSNSYYKKLVIHYTDSWEEKSYEKNITPNES